jgi:hypothetical protein
MVREERSTGLEEQFVGGALHLRPEAMRELRYGM